MLPILNEISSGIENSTWGGLFEGDYIVVFKPGACVIAIFVVLPRALDAEDSSMGNGHGNSRKRGPEPG